MRSLTGHSSAVCPALRSTMAMRSGRSSRTRQVLELRRPGLQDRQLKKLSELSSQVRIILLSSMVVTVCRCFMRQMLLSLGMSISRDIPTSRNSTLLQSGTNSVSPMDTFTGATSSPILTVRVSRQHTTTRHSGYRQEFLSGQVIPQ
ncbi:MAG: hypothetical protein BWY61_01322 [Firmicutes bacterium ADurb.Bin354]|nr:MAG: hypothetical protein BWY61_01322 [Firmicutes bacterium ADurb.Bin354]